MKINTCIGLLDIDDSNTVKSNVAGGDAEKVLSVQTFSKFTAEEVNILMQKIKALAHSYRIPNIELTKASLKESVSDDDFIIQCVRTIEEANRVINFFAKRVREWYELWNPEFSRKVHDHISFARLILEKSREELLKEMGLEETMGADISEEDQVPIKELARCLLNINDMKKKEIAYLEEVTQRHMRNVIFLTGSLIGGKLLSIAGSLRKLALFPASSIQLLGAEKALFRHLRTHAKSPKYGVLFQHPLVAGVCQKKRGKAARMLAAKIAIAARTDFFKGAFVADKLKKELDEKIGGY